MPSQQDIDQQVQLLAIYRRNLQLLLDQEARHGGRFQSPVSLVNQIQDTRENIKRIKKILLSWNVPVTNEVQDEEEPGGTVIQTPDISKKGIQRTTWIIVIVTLAGLSGVAIAIFLNSEILRPQSTNRFTYLVRVQDDIRSQAIVGAKVTIESSGLIPIDEFTDNNGLVIMSIDSSLVGKFGRIIVEAPGYKRYEQNITLSEEELPQIIRLEPEL